MFDKKQLIQSVHYCYQALEITYLEANRMLFKENSNLEVMIGVHVHSLLM